MGLYDDLPAPVNNPVRVHESLKPNTVPIVASSFYMEEEEPMPDESLIDDFNVDIPYLEDLMVKVGAMHFLDPEWKPKSVQMDTTSRATKKNAAVDVAGPAKKARLSVREESLKCLNGDTKPVAATGGVGRKDCTSVKGTEMDI